MERAQMLYGWRDKAALDPHRARGKPQEPTARERNKKRALRAHELLNEAAALGAELVDPWDDD